MAKDRNVGGLMFKSHWGETKWISRFITVLTNKKIKKSISIIKVSNHISLHKIFAKKGTISRGCPFVKI